jgi:hypothetical protein
MNLEDAMRFPNAYPEPDGTMNVKGFFVGLIDKLSSRYIHGDILEESLEMGGWSRDTYTQHLPERLWRTLVADRGPDNTSPPSWYRTACLHAISESYSGGDLITTELLKDPKCSQVVADFLRRVQSVVCNRRFLLSKSLLKDDQLFGLAPANTRVGDIICILYGCSVPVILRRRDKTPNDDCFEVIGESFIYGLMDGEAFEMFGTLLGIRERTFKLC